MYKEHILFRCLAAYIFYFLGPEFNKHIERLFVTQIAFIGYTLHGSNMAQYSDDDRRRRSDSSSSSAKKHHSLHPFPVTAMTFSLGSGYVGQNLILVHHLDPLVNVSSLERRAHRVEDPPHVRLGSHQIRGGIRTGVVVAMISFNEIFKPMIIKHLIILDTIELHSPLDGTGIGDSGMKTPSVSFALESPWR
jgi:hypothetical protein